MTLQGKLTTKPPLEWHFAGERLYDIMVIILVSLVKQIWFQILALPLKYLYDIGQVTSLSPILSYNKYFP